MRKSLSLLLCLSFTAVYAQKFGLHFDDNGNLIRPDQEYLARGLDDEKDGFRQSALKNFIKSAEYGNHLAMSLVGLYKMQDKDYVGALAWYMLVNSEKLPNGENFATFINNLKSFMKPEEVKEANQLKAELVETYGSYATLMKRERWKNSLRFTGTRIKGHIPAFLRIELTSGLFVTSEAIKKQVDNFIYNYEFDPGTGEVTLDDVELVEDEEG